MASSVAVLCLAAWLPAACASEGADERTPASSGDAAEPDAGDRERPREGGAEPQREATPPGRELLPDLQVMPLRELYLEGGEDGRTLRFSTTVINTGPGPLELVGGDAGDGTFVASQRTLHANGTYSAEEVGRFVFHPSHAHWHFEDFTLLEVLSLDDEGGGDEVVASTGKGTFCAVDEVPEQEGAAPPAYFTCGEGVQGISSGWSDTYGAEIPGQELWLGDLPDGRYALRSTVDPDNRLRETDDANNSRTEIVEISGQEIRAVEGG